MVKNLPASAGDTRDVCSVPRLGGSPGEGNGNPLQYSCLGNPKDRGACQATAYGVTESQTWLSTYTGIKMYPGRLSLDSLNFGSEGKASACNAGDLGSIPGSGRSYGEGNGNPLQYICPENPMDGRAW